MNRGWIVGALTAVAVFAAACSGVNVKEAQTLAISGEKAATSLRDEAMTTRERFARVPNRFAIYRRLVLVNTLGQGELLTPEQVTDQAGAGEAEIFEKGQMVTEILRSREKMLDDLVDTYGGFKVLAEYDSAGETKAAFDRFSGSANQFISAVAIATGGTALTIPAFVIPAARGAVVLVAEERHKQHIKEASAQIRDALTKIHDALKAEKEYAIAVREDLFLDTASLREQLYEAGLAKEDLSPLAQEAAALADIEVASNVGSAIRASPNVAAALKSYRNLKEERELGRLEEAYNTSLKVFEQLIEQHHRLESEDPFDLARLEALVARLAAIYEESRKASNNAN